jgi:5-dehydro-2-deoxygluconokinase
VSEAVVIGRCGIDLYPNEPPTPLRHVRTRGSSGGFADSVWTGLARLDVRAAIGNEEEGAAARVSDLPRPILKRGERGATVFEHGTRTDIPPVPVDVVNGLGAGDAFAAAVGQALPSGRRLAAGRRGTVAGAVVAGRLACSEGMPRLDELEPAVAGAADQGAET